ncbi:MAG: hypothetical protein QNK04_14355 [Myxococcota bacterium]|nr:hypothetical protein [Myxococcota bacterium]
MTRRAPVALCLLALLLTGAQPCGLLAGGRLEGEPAAAPADWSALGESAGCQLEVRPEDPRSVNVTCKVRDGKLYVASLVAARKRWVKLLEAEADVRVRIAGRIYELRATRITDPDERRRVMKPDGGEPRKGTWLWRLDARAGAQAPRRPGPAFS